MIEKGEPLAMDSIQRFRVKLTLLENLLSQMKNSHSRVKQLKRNVYILQALLRKQENIKSPYGPSTPIVRFSLQ